MATMKAAVIPVSGGADVFKLEKIPIPIAQKGQGFSPDVKFPRVLGIEAVGLVENAPGKEFRKSDIVATAMGGLGRQFDGGYAEYICVPATQVQQLTTSLSWEILNAIPEMLQTAWGSLFRSLRLKKGKQFLIRGRTSSVGLAAAALAKNHGAFVAATTRRTDREDLLWTSEVDHVFIDSGSIENEVGKKFPDGFDKVLELVGTSVLKDSLRRDKPGGIV